MLRLRPVVTRVVTAGKISSVGSLDPDDAHARIGELVGGERSGNQFGDRRDRDPVKREHVSWCRHERAYSTAFQWLISDRAGRDDPGISACPGYPARRVESTGRSAPSVRVRLAGPVNVEEALSSS